MIRRAREKSPPKQSLDGAPYGISSGAIRRLRILDWTSPAIPRPGRSLTAGVQCRAASEEGTYDTRKAFSGGVDWNVLAGFRWLRQRGPGGGVSWLGDRLSGRGVRLRPHRAHHGVCHRPHLGLPFESGGLGGPVVGKRFPASDLLAYVVAQVVGGIAGAGVLYVIASGKAGFDLAGGFASNGYGAHSPGGYSLVACLVAEVVLTFMFLIIILGATDRRAPQGFAPIAIGLGLTLIHLIGIPVTNLSVNPARSTGPALFVGGWAIEQLWLFWLAPIVGGVLGGGIYRGLFGEAD